MMFNVSIFSFLRMNLIDDIYYDDVNRKFEDTDPLNKRLNWNLRLKNDFIFTKTTLLQVTFIYHSSSKSFQRAMEEFFTFNMAVRQIFFKNWDLTLKIRDIFKTGKFEFTSGDENFTSHQVFTREAPMFILNLHYNFNNYKGHKIKKENQIDEGEIDNF